MQIVSSISAAHADCDLGALDRQSGPFPSQGLPEPRQLSMYKVCYRVGAQSAGGHQSAAESVLRLYTWWTQT